MMIVYHFVPKNQKGDIIYPLNQLKYKYPEIYKKHFAKYNNIKEKDVEIPGFGYWNDCINLMPINPALVKQELENFGHSTNWEWKFYKIDTDNLDTSKLIIMTVTEDNAILRRHFIPFSKQAFERYCHIGDATREVFKKAKNKGEQPNTFARMPHVLYKDSINTSNLEIVEL